MSLDQVLATRLPGADLSIDWPNDPLAGGAKIVGILMEREGRRGDRHGREPGPSPTDLGRATTSVAAITGARARCR